MNQHRARSLAWGVFALIVVLLIAQGSSAGSPGRTRSTPTSPGRTAASCPSSWDSRCSRSPSWVRDRPASSRELHRVDHARDRLRLRVPDGRVCEVCAGHTWGRPPVRQDSCRDRWTVVDPVHRPRRLLPAPPLPRRPPALATVALVRPRGGHRDGARLHRDLGRAEARVVPDHRQPAGGAGARALVLRPGSGSDRDRGRGDQPRAPLPAIERHGATPAQMARGRSLGRRRDLRRHVHPLVRVRQRARTDTDVDVAPAEPVVVHVRPHPGGDRRSPC